MSIYNRLTQRDAPVAGPNPNMTPMTRKPMSLRDAVRKYADGGDVNDPYNQQSGQGSIDPNSIADILRIIQAQSQTASPLPTNISKFVRPPERQYMEEQMGDRKSSLPPEYQEPVRPPEPQIPEPQIPDPYGGYTPMTDDREAQRAAEDKAREQASIAKQRASEQFYYQMARQDLGDGTYRRHRDGAIVDKDNNVIAYPTPPSQPVSPEPPQNYWQNPQEQYAMPPQEQYAVPPAPPQEQYAVAPPRMEPTRPIPMPIDETGWTAATRPAAQPQSTNWVQSILGGPGLGTGLPGSAQAPAQNSLDAMINMLQQRNKQ